MLTNLPEDETVLFHPIVFFDQGTFFFEARRRLDGDALLRCDFAGLAEGPGGGVEERELLVMDPIAPLRRLEVACTLTRPTTNGKPGRPSVGLECGVRCSAIGRGSWGLLAAMGPEELDRVRAAAGELPERHAGFGEEEWLLRHAFSDERVRENSFLAATLARLPIVFARAEEGGIRFRHPLLHFNGRYLGADCHLIAVVDTSVCG